MIRTIRDLWLRFEAWRADRAIHALEEDIAQRRETVTGIERVRSLSQIISTR